MMGETPMRQTTILTWHFLSVLCVFVISVSKLISPDQGSSLGVTDVPRRGQHWPSERIRRDSSNVQHSARLVARDPGPTLTTSACSTPSILLVASF